MSKENKERKILSSRAALATMGAAICVLAFTSHGKAQQVLYQEGFNTDGSGTRYTVDGGGVLEVNQIDPSLAQLGPVYWARSSDVSFVGVPGATPARRALFTWHHTIDPSTVTISPQFGTLFDATVNWLTKGKTNLRVLYSADASSPAGPGDQYLIDRLTAKGATITSDPAVAGGINTPLPAATDFDLVLKTSGGDSGLPSRYTSFHVPMLIYNAADLDDELVSSIGQSAQSLEIPAINIKTNHPAAGGLTGSVPLITGGPAPFDTIGDFLPENSVVLAEYGRTNAFVVNSLDLANQLISNTIPSIKATNTITAADIADTTTGSWPLDNPPPGTPTDTYVLVGRGQIQVTTPGKYSFALGLDDGGRLRIDRDKNGLSAADTVITVDSTGGFRNTIADVDFAAAGTYDFEWVMFDAGGDAGSEVSVALAAGGGGIEPIDSSAWEVLGTDNPTSPVRLSGPITVVSYSPTVPTVVETHPFIVLLEEGSAGGLVLSGGPFIGFEGSAFWGGSGMNKGGDTWPLPASGDRTLTLNPINVAGKTNVQITMAVAGTFLDFEQSNGSRGSSDYLEMVIDPDGSGPLDFQRLMFFTAPSGSLKYFDDRTTHPGNPTRLGLRFQDVTYNVPPGATDMVIQIRGITTFWNEIVAFDNIRVTAGATASAPTISIAKGSTGPVITFTGSLQRSDKLPATSWTDVAATSPYTVPAGSATAFFRAKN